MKLDDARTHFFRMHYFWARDFLLAEIKSGFPNLRRVRNSFVSNYLDFIERLSPNEQERHGLAIQKFRYRDVLVGTVHEITESDISCAKSYERHISNLRALALMRNFGDRRYSMDGNDRKLLRKSLKMELDKIPGLEFKDLGGGGWTYCKRIRNLLVSTNIGTGSPKSSLIYDHRVFVTARYGIYEGVSILTWLGVAGSTFWDDLRSEDLETTAIDLCHLARLFLDQAESFIDNISVELPVEEN